MISKPEHKSKLVRLLQEIDRQNEASYQALHRLAYGASR